MRFKIIVLVTLIVCSAAGVLVLKVHRQPQVTTSKNLYMPLQFNGWQGSDLGLSEAAVDMIRPDFYCFRNYQKNGQIVNLYLGYYNSLKKSDSAHIPSRCYPAQGWEVVEDKKTTTFVSGRKLVFSRMNVNKDGDSEIVYFAYRNSNLITSDLLKLRTHLVKQLIQGKNTDNALIRFSVPVNPDNREIAEKTLQGFIADVYPLLDKLFLDDNGDQDVRPTI